LIQLDVRGWCNARTVGLLFGMGQLLIVIVISRISKALLKS